MPLRLIVDELPWLVLTSVTPPVAVRTPAALITTLPAVAPGAKVPKSKAVVEDTDKVLTRTAEDVTVPLAVYCAKAVGAAKRLEPERIPSILRAYQKGRRDDPVLLLIPFLSRVVSTARRARQNHAETEALRPLGCNGIDSLSTVLKEVQLVTR